jgi:hypothetical protein
VFVSENSEPDTEKQSERNGDQSELEGDDESMLELVTRQDVGVLAPPDGAAVLSLDVASLLAEPDSSTERIENECDEDNQ